MAIKEKTQSTNDNHNYDNRRSYNNLPLHPGECLVPIRVDWEMVKHFNMCRDNLETWHIGPNKVLVAFAPVAIEAKEASIKAFYRDVREYFASFHTDDAPKGRFLKNCTLANHRATLISRLHKTLLRNFISANKSLT